MTQKKKILIIAAVAAMMSPLAGATEPAAMKVERAVTPTGTSTGGAATPLKIIHAQTGKPAIVFLVAGQSNAEGTGVLSPQTHAALGRHDGTKGQKRRPLTPMSTASEIGLPIRASDYTHSYIWVPEQGFSGVDPETNLRPSSLHSKWHGMELPVIRELENRFPNNDIFVVKHALGGTSLHRHWNPTQSDGLYAKWLGYYRNAIAQLSREYPEVRVVGLYWDQGESDGIDGKHGEYAANLKNLIATVRKDTGLPTLPIFIRKHIFKGPNIDAIISAQKEIVEQDPHCYLLDIDCGNRAGNYQAWAYSPGNGHISSKGFVELTKRLFDGPLRDATVESFDKVNRELVKD
jgi:hypothetical protein